MLTRLRAILRQRDSKSPIHITIQGPYKNPPSSSKLDSMWEILDGEGVLLNGIGKFEFPDKHIVYLRSHSRAIRKIWWKRDYPIIRYGFNPHITLFEGTPAEAVLVQEFLKNENIELYCRKFALSLHKTISDDLFPQSNREVIYSSLEIDRNPLIQPYRWRAGMEQRAEKLAWKMKTERARQLELGREENLES